MALAKVYGGTPVGSESRCDTCGNAYVIRGYRESERITICDAPFRPMVIPFKVAECSGYRDRNKPDWEQMQKYAIDLTVERNVKVKGFGFGEIAAGDDEDDSGDEVNEVPQTTDA